MSIQLAIAVALLNIWIHFYRLATFTISPLNLKEKFELRILRGSWTFLQQKCHHWWLMWTLGPCTFWCYFRFSSFLQKNRINLIVPHLHHFYNGNILKYVFHSTLLLMMRLVVVVYAMVLKFFSTPDKLT